MNEMKDAIKKCLLGTATITSDEETDRAAAFFTATGCQPDELAAMPLLHGSSSIKIEVFSTKRPVCSVVVVAELAPGVDPVYQQLLTGQRVMREARMRAADGTVVNRLTWGEQSYSYTLAVTLAATGGFEPVTA